MEAGERPVRYRRGDVVTGPDFIGPGNQRPYVIMSGDDHPFGRTESIVVLVTTTGRDQAVHLPPASFVQGGLPRDSYASPWVRTTLKHAEIEEKVGVLSQEVVARIAGETAAYIGLGP